MATTDTGRGGLCDEPHVECMLFPERLDYWYLMEKKSLMASYNYEMQYLNVGETYHSSSLSTGWTLQNVGLSWSGIRRWWL